MPPAPKRSINPLKLMKRGFNAWLRASYSTYTPIYFPATLAQLETFCAGNRIDLAL